MVDEKRVWGDIYVAPATERISMVKEGVLADVVTSLVLDMAVSKDWFYRTLGLGRATIDRKLKTNARLGRAESEGVLGMARLIGQVEHMVESSGDPLHFNAARWVAEWLEQPVAALGGKTPASYMDTDEGRALVSGLVAQMQSGAYA